MEALKYISVRGRMAYLICSFEKLLIRYDCNKEEWIALLEKLWSYTNVQYLEDWMYELAEYMPNSVLEDTVDGAEYITENEFEKLHEIYSKTEYDILLFLQIIYECGTCDLYSRLCDYSPSTLKKVEEALKLLKINSVDIVDVKPFEIYSFNDGDGWGVCFEGKQLSEFL